MIFLCYYFSPGCGTKYLGNFFSRSSIREAESVVNIHEGVSFHDCKGGLGESKIFRVGHQEGKSGPLRLS